MRHNRIIPALIAVALVVAPLARPLRAQGGPAPAACGEAEHRQFDFWIGHWRVSDVTGELLGFNRIDRVLGGCALHENWQGVAGLWGHSYTVYAAARGGWHQTWVDSGGTLLLLDGGLNEAGEMVLRGEGVSTQGERVLNRLTWTPIDADRVRQRWEVSPDDGATWRTVFDGRYRRTRRSPDAAPPDPEALPPPHLDEEP